MSHPLATPDTAADLLPPARLPAPGGIFYPHGIWAPGVRLMRNMQFASKALLICALFILPIAWVTLSYLSDKLAAIEFSSKEIDGVAYNRVLYRMLDVAQQLRRDSQLAAITGSAPPTLAEIRNKMQELQAQLAQNEKRLGASLGTGKAYAALQSAFSAADGTKDKDKVFDAHTAHLEAIAALLVRATDGSNLALDPDLDSYYLMDAVYFRVPDIALNTASVRGVGNFVLAAGRISPEVGRRFIEKMAIVDFQFRSMRDGLSKSIAANPELRKSVDAKSALDATDTFTQLAQRSLIEEPDFSPAFRERFLIAANDTVSSQFKLAVALENELERLLKQRVAGLKNHLMISLAALVMGLLLATYFFYCFFLVTRGGLRVISQHLQELSAGDLRKAPSQPWGKDEPAQVIVDLRKTYDALHQLIRRVSHSARELNLTAKEIASASTDLSSRTEAAAASLQEQSAAMEQIGSTVSVTAERAQTASAFSAESAETAQKGGKVIGQVVGTMAEIRGSSTKIRDIISVIDGIAFQTNILALNAAVEAARAGDAGRGFTVVASEVRTLAQRSAEAAREIKTLITASVSSVESGTAVVEGAGTTMSSVVSNVQQINTYLSEIATAAREQASGVEQVVQAIQALDRDTQQNSALVEESSAAAEALRSQADLLMQEIANFRVD
ncbi:MAG: methyl-accepting chemotaxis protein [Curvibacter sp.]